MGKRFDTLLFPGGKSKAFTLSYDDGTVQDRRLAEIFRSRGLKCTFNLNSAIFGHQEIARMPGRPEVDISRLNTEELTTVYAGHEIAGHGLWHSSLDTVGTPLAMYEVIEDRRRLEAITCKPLKMFAYPFGLVSNEAVEILRLAGYQGARTIVSSHEFKLPEDFMRWDPTCHHKDEKLMELAEKFLNGFSFGPQLFYVWGHAFEFDGDNNWEIIERFADFMAPHADKVWFATNGEIIDYVNAWKRLEYTADGRYIYNPSAMDVTIRIAWDSVVLKAGTVTPIPETPV